MKKSNATASWKGSGKEGKGTLSTGSGVLSGIAYDYRSRFEEGPLTNPEELVAAAHAGCFSMKLSFVLGAAGFTASTIDTTCTISLENGVITASHLELKASVPGIEKDKFEACANEAKAGCPISKSLNPDIAITLQASLV